MMRVVRAGAFALPNTGNKANTKAPLVAPQQKSSPSAAPSSSSHAAAPRRRRAVAHAQATTVLIELGLAAAAAWVAARPQTDPSEGGSRDCATCGGTGKEECACRRWSDTDVGCNTCSYSGYAPCRSCGGGGTAVPVALTVRKLAPEDMERLQRDEQERRRGSPL